MDDNQRRDSNSKFIRSSDPDFYITNSKRPQNRNNDEAGRSRQQNAPSGKKMPAGKKKASGRKNSKPPYAGKKIPKSGRPASSSEDRNIKRQPYGGSKRSIPDEEYRRYMYQLRKKQVMRNRIIAGVVLAVLIISAVVFSLSLTVWFPIQELVVNTNDSAYSVTEIKHASKVSFGSDNLLRCDLEKVEKNIETVLPYVGKASAKRKLPNTLIVDVEKTAAVAAVENGRFVLLVNEEGKILQQMAEVPFDLKLVKYGKLNQTAVGEIVSSENGVPVSVYVSLVKAMRENGLNDITVIDISVPDNITLNYQDRIEIKLGKAEDINIKIGVAVKAITEEDEKYSTVQKGTLDLTYPLGEAHFVPYVEKEETTSDTEETTVTSVFDSPLKPPEDEEENDGEEDDTKKTTEKKKEKTSSEDSTEKKTENREEKTTEKREREKTTSEENGDNERENNRSEEEN